MQFVTGQQETFVVLDRLSRSNDFSELSDHEILMLVKVEVRGLANPRIIMEHIKEYRSVLKK
jgi:hypothetical protein